MAVRVTVPRPEVKPLRPPPARVAREAMAPIRDHHADHLLYFILGLLAIFYVVAWLCVLMGHPVLGWALVGLLVNMSVGVAWLMRIDMLSTFFTLPTMLAGLTSTVASFISLALQSIGLVERSNHLLFYLISFGVFGFMCVVLPRLAARQQELVAGKCA